MTARFLGRGHGIAIHCNEGALESSTENCRAVHITANVVIKHNRAAAAKVGWIRGGGKGRAYFDFCPDHAETERARVKAEKAAAIERNRERNRERAEARKAKAAAKEARRIERELARAAKESTASPQPVGEHE